MNDVLVIVNVMESHRKANKGILMNIEDYVSDNGKMFNSKVLVVRNILVVPMMQKSYLTNSVLYDTLDSNDYIVDYDSFKIADYFSSQDHLIFIGDNHHQMISMLAKQCMDAGIRCSAIPDCHYGPTLNDGIIYA